MKFAVLGHAGSRIAAEPSRRGYQVTAIRVIHSQRGQLAGSSSEPKPPTHNAGLVHGGRGRFGLRNHEVATLEEIAAVMGVTRERVRQIQIESLKRLRTLIEAQGFMADVVLP